LESGWRDILDLGLGLNPTTEIGAQKTRSVQVNLVPQDLRQLLFQCEEPQARYVPTLKLDQYINVAIRSEVVAKDRPEQRKPANLVASAERRKLFPIDDVAPFHRSALFPRTIILRYGREDAKPAQ
jgi:hypothetical protein